MRTTSLLVTAALLFAQASALAQPGASPPPPPPPPPNYYPPQSYQPPPQGLTPEEQELLAEGEISDGAHVGGTLLSIFIGFGSGQAVQGRWGDTGWIFTLGEVASIAMIIYGAEQEANDDCFYGNEPDCDEDAGALPITIGLIGFVVLHVWEVVDAIAGPARHNRRVRNLRMRMGYPPAGYYYGQVEPYVTPVGKNDDDGAIAGIRVRF
jgi:hypothetical protein